MIRSEENTQALIFDVDGTLYDQGKLRRRMFFELLCRFVKKPRLVRDIHVLYRFRKNREILSKENDNSGCLETRQYEEVAHELGVAVDKIRSVVNDWIFERPLNHMAACMYPGVKELFSLLIIEKIKIGIFSDYPCQDKLRVLGLHADAMVCATEKEVDRFKPHPMGLLFTAEKLGIPVRNCFFIGDRDDKDGECARRAGMPYLILSRGRFSAANWYRKMGMQINRKRESCFIENFQ